jgi:Predicted membrane protein (DUF2306)
MAGRAKVAASTAGEKIMLIVHIVAGSLALGAGALALFARKGGEWHRRAGMVFAMAMLVMTATGAVLAALKPEPLSVTAGLLTFYLVCTGVLTLRRTVAEARGTYRAFMLMALGVGAGALVTALPYVGQPRTGGLVVMLCIFGGVALLAAVADMRVLAAGHIQGAQRITRHLWRMGLALLIANLSFFLGQAKLLPQPLRPFGFVPVLVVLLVVIWWLVRVRWPRRRAVAARAA